MVIRVDVIGGDTGQALKKGSERRNGDFVFVNNGSGDIVLHVDEGVMVTPKPGDGRPHYALLAESPALRGVDKVYRVLTENPSAIVDRFRKVFVYDPRHAHLPNVVRLAIAQPWIKNPRLYPKTKLCSMITSSKAWVPGHRLRLAFAKQNCDKLDLFGRGIREIKTKEEGLRDYRFSVAFENARWPGYFTEKIVDCFLTGTVPIYYGDPRIGDFFDVRGIIVLAGSRLPHLTPALYDRMLPYVRDNYERAQQFRRSRIQRLYDQL